MRYKYIFWDFNGTLIDDVTFNMDIMNGMLKDKKLKQLNGIEDYHKVFCFPVKKYYENCGFDFTKTSFEELADIYVDKYYNNYMCCKLYDGAEDILNEFKNKGLKQILLSATKQDKLDKMAKDFSITHYFDDIIGISNYYAESKIHMAKHYILKNNIDKNSAVFIGDTKHDFDVSQAVGSDCILIANGHQSKETLSETNAIVVNNIKEVKKYINAGI